MAIPTDYKGRLIDRRVAAIKKMVIAYLEELKALDPNFDYKDLSKTVIVTRPEQPHIPGQS